MVGTNPNRPFMFHRACIIAALSTVFLNTRTCALIPLLFQPVCLLNLDFSILINVDIFPPMDWYFFQNLPHPAPTDEASPVMDAQKLIVMRMDCHVFLIVPHPKNATSCLGSYIWIFASKLLLNLFQ